MGDKFSDNPCRASAEENSLGKSFVRCLATSGPEKPSKTQKMPMSLLPSNGKEV